MPFRNAVRRFFVVFASASVWTVLNLPALAQVVSPATTGPANGGVRASGGVESSEGSAPGGAAFADFTSLMDLIQTTIAPEAWEALGGTSTMSSYPQGVYVDPTGLLKPCEQRPELPRSVVAAVQSAAVGLAAIGQRPRKALDDTRGNWTRGTGLRMVSLARMQRLARQRLLGGQTLGPDLLHTAGLADIRYVLFEPEDVLLIGPIERLEIRDDHLISLPSNLPPIQWDQWRAAATSVARNEPFGCTIDPTPQGLAAASQVAAAVGTGKQPFGTADVAMAEALGSQRVGVFGIDADTMVALRMVEADRHMKRLALGLEPMPDRVGDYWTFIARHLASGPPTDLLLRLWFAPQAIDLRQTADGRAFELAGEGLRLSVENQLAIPGGGRGDVVRDPASIEFVESFNENFHAIRREYPVYGWLQSLYESAAVVQVIASRGASIGEDTVRGWIDIDPHAHEVRPAPALVDSIAVSRSLRHASKRHRILIASGGVSVDPRSMVSTQTTVSPSLQSVLPIAKEAEGPTDRWWWDLDP